MQYSPYMYTSYVELFNSYIFLLMHRFFIYIFSIFLFFITPYSPSSILIATQNPYFIDMEEQLRFLYGRVEYLEKKVRELAEAVNGFNYADNMIYDPFISEENSVTSILETIKIDEEEKNLYEDAFSSLRIGELADAEKKLENFVLQKPDSPLIGHAYYWLAEIYWNDQDYKKASLNFLKAYKNSVADNKKQASLYKLAISLDMIGDSKNACSILKKMHLQFPNMNDYIRKDIERYQKKIKDCI